MLPGTERSEAVRAKQEKSKETSMSLSLTHALSVNVCTPIHLEMLQIYGRFKCHYKVCHV